VRQGLFGRKAMLDSTEGGSQTLTREQKGKSIEVTKIRQVNEQLRD
jgi:hypothetical protein